MFIDIVLIASGSVKGRKTLKRHHRNPSVAEQERHSFHPR